MSFQKYRSLDQAAIELRKRGYVHDFTFRRGCLVLLNMGKSYSAEELIIDEYHRFQGEGVGQTTTKVVFAFETKTGEKGTLNIQYDLEANMDLIKFINDVPVRILPENR